jgi:hypothetical protein
LGKGSIGKVLPGREVKLAEDGEILVRGGGVSSGYWDSGGAQSVANEEGWYRTGDIGALDEAGNLYFKGRKKEVIVTPGGTNVYPDDLEAALRKQPEVKDCVVVGMERGGNAEPCAVVILRGEAKMAEVVQRANQWLAEYQRSKETVSFPPGPAAATKGKVYLIDRPGSVQTTLLMGNLAIERSDPDYPALVVLNEVLGAGSASRLFLNLREEKGYTYGVYSNFVARKYAGPWTAGGDLRTEVTDGAMTEFLRELNRIRDEKVPEEELDAARRSVVARFALSLESAQQLIGYALTRKEYDFPADYWDKYPAQIAAITAEDVQRVAKKYIDPGTMQVVAVGDASKIKTVMEKYGPVEMVDASGKPAVEAGKSAGAGVY